MWCDHHAIGPATAERLQAIYQGLSVIREHQPEAAAVEELFFSRNVRTALSVGHARGVALLALADAGLPIYEYKPLEVKQAIAGYGGADKRRSRRWCACCSIWSVCLSPTMLPMPWPWQSATSTRRADGCCIDARYL